MAHETLVTQTLTQQMIDEGAALLRTLDSQGFKTTAALWFYLEPSDTWRLILASPEVQSEGPKHLYERVQKVLGDGSNKIRITLRDISVVPSDDPLIKLLRMAIETGPNDISGIRFSRNTINGQFIQDAYIYRLT
jgi:hypothetical protein